MSNTTIPTASNTASETLSKQASTPTSKITSTQDAAAIFEECADLCYALFTVLGAVGQFINNTLKQMNADLNARNSAQQLSIDSGPAISADPPKDDLNFPLGGGTPSADGNNSVNIIATKRANDLLDYLHSFGLAMDFPAGYATNPSLKLDENTRRKAIVGTFKEWGLSLNAQSDRLKNSATVETTKAEGALKSSSAAIELATSIIKNNIAIAQSINTQFKM